MLRLPIKRLSKSLSNDLIAPEPAFLHISDSFTMGQVEAYSEGCSFRTLPRYRRLRPDLGLARPRPRGHRAL